MLRTIEQFMTWLGSDLPADTRVRSHLTLPASEPPWRPESLSQLPDRLAAMLRRLGIEQLSVAQWQFLDAVQHGQHVCLAAPAGSGRGVARLLALFRTLSEHRPAYALCIVPQKQRELAQLKTIMAWNDSLAPQYRVTAAIYDGDTPKTQRRTIKQSPPALLLTTPEMLHAGILAYHGGWRAVLQHLRYIVLTDLHLCQSALMVHLAHLWRRLLRICRHYGAQPQYLMTSAPFGNLHSVVQALSGAAGTVISGPAWRRQPQTRTLLETTGDTAPLVRQLTTRLHAAGLSPVVLQQHDATLPAEARSLLCSGLPSSMTQLHEHLSRLASRTQPGLSIAVLTGQNPLERYLLRYPAVYQTHWEQDLPLDPNNRSIMQQHLLCAAAELALEAGERYPGLHGVGEVIRQLAADQAIERRTATRQWIATGRQPHRGVRLRIYDRPFAVVQHDDRRFLTSLDAPRAFREAFEGAILLHAGQTFHVERCLPERRRIVVRPGSASYRTRALLTTAVTQPRIEAAFSTAMFHMTYGSLHYTLRRQAYERLDAVTRARLSVHALPDSQWHIRSRGVWIDVGDTIRQASENFEVAAHTLIHAVLAAVPLVLAQDATGVQGGLYPLEGVTTAPPSAIFTDTQDGGNGVSACLYAAYERLLRIALQLLLQCSCDQACHRCIGGLRCDTCQDTGEVDRLAGVQLLQQLLQEAAPPLECVMLPAETSLFSQREQRPRHVYLCLSTRQSAEEVGGWQQKHLLGLAIAVLYDTHDDQYRVYTAETVESLLRHLHTADLVIGFNPRDFDYQVLQPYTRSPLTSLPTLAVLEDVQQAVGFRLSFSHLARQTLGIERPEESLQTPQWFREGAHHRVVTHCRRDVDLLRDLVRYGSQTGTLLYRDHTGQPIAFAVNWRIPEPDG